VDVDFFRETDVDFFREIQFFFLNVKSVAVYSLSLVLTIRRTAADGPGLLPVPRRRISCVHTHGDARDESGDA